MTSRDMANLAYQVIDSKQGENIKLIDISEISVIADYFLIASANNINQLQAMADEIIERFEKEGISIKQLEGNKNATWILLDYADLVIHLFDKEDRLFYDLERIWTDGKIIENI